MNVSQVREGMPVKIVKLVTEKLGARAMGKQHLNARKKGAKGKVLGPALGRRDLWLVKHGENDIGVYKAEEFEPVPS